MKRRWLEYQCSLPTVTLEELLSKQISLFKLMVENIVQFEDGTYGVTGILINDTASAVNNDFKLFKTQLKDFLGTKKIIDKHIAKGYCL